VALMRQYEPALTESFDETYARGVAFTPKPRMKRWFDADHFSVAVRRELRDHWEHYLTTLGVADKPVLLIGDMHDQIILSRKDIYHQVGE
jgi:hypothetical protein